MHRYLLGLSSRKTQCAFLAGPSVTREHDGVLADTLPRSVCCSFMSVFAVNGQPLVRAQLCWRCREPAKKAHSTVNNQSHNQTHNLMRFLCLRAVMLILTWRIYYFHRTQRLPRHLTAGDDFCGMGVEKTTAARGACRDWLWTRAPAHGGVGKLEQHP